MLKRKRDINDNDGMWEDLKSFYAHYSKDELIDIIMTLKHENQDHNDYLEDWVDLCYGEVTGEI